MSSQQRFRWSDYKRWYSSLSEGRSAIQDAEPWITFGARDFLASRLTPTSRVFEWGSGGSTLFLLQHAAEVVTVEHDATWFARLHNHLNGLDHSHWKGVLVEPEIATYPRIDDSIAGDWTNYVSGDGDYDTHSFHRYVTVVDQYPDDYFDIVMVDGRARPACLVHGWQKLKPGGVLILDNAEVKYYDPAIRLLLGHGAQQIAFSGSGPYIKNFWRTSAFVRPLEFQQFKIASAA